MVKKALETAATVKDTFDNIRGLIFALGMIGMGVVVYLDPNGKVSEIEEIAPYREWIAYGAIGFGVLFLMAIFARGNTKKRATALVLLMTAVGVIWGLGALMLPKANNAYNLADEGTVHARYRHARCDFLPEQEQAATKATLRLRPRRVRDTFAVKSRPRRESARARAVPSRRPQSRRARSGRRNGTMADSERGRAGSRAALWAIVLGTHVVRASSSVPFNVDRAFSSRCRTRTWKTESEDSARRNPS